MNNIEKLKISLLRGLFCIIIDILSLCRAECKKYFPIVFSLQHQKTTMHLRKEFVIIYKLFCLILEQMNKQ